MSYRLRTRGHQHSCSQHGVVLLAGRFRISDLIDEEPNSALGDDVRSAVADLNGDHSRGCVDAQHGEEVDHWISAPADHCHELGALDLALDSLICLTVGGGRKTNKELIHDVEEEAHGQKPAKPARSEVTGDNQLTVVARDDHESRANSKYPRLATVFLRSQIHHQENLNEQKRHSQQPVHVTVRIIERYT